MRRRFSARRNVSMARCLAAVINQAAGVSGTPRSAAVEALTARPGRRPRPGPGRGSGASARRPVAGTPARQSAVMVSAVVRPCGQPRGQPHGRIRPVTQLSEGPAARGDLAQRRDHSRSGQCLRCRSTNSFCPATASSSVSYCMIAQPPTTSFDSAYGPSTRVDSPSRTTKLTASSVPYRPPRRGTAGARLLADVGVHRLHQSLGRCPDALFHPDETHETRHCFLLETPSSPLVGGASPLRRTASAPFDIALENIYDRIARGGRPGGRSLAACLA